MLRETDRGAVSALYRPVPAASLAFTRIAFGLVVAWEAWRYLDPAHRWVDAYYVDPRLVFGYWPFEWVSPLPAPWIHVVFVVLGVAGLAFAAGYRYRLAAPAVFIGLSYIFLLDKTRYLNHWYLMILIAAVLAVTPAHRYWSLDARRRPDIASSSVPLWSLILVRAQVGIPYFVGGLAKLNGDWLRGRPLQDWVADDGDFPVIGPFMDDRWLVLVLVYVALALDLLVVPLLLTERGRPVALGAVVVFHLMNDRLFSIGVFPWMMILATLIFLSPDWPNRVLAALRNPPSARSVAFIAGAWVGGVVGARFPGRFMLLPTLTTALAGGIVAFVIAERFAPEQSPAAPKPAWPGSAAKPWAAAGLAAWLLIQVLVPLRHHVIPGDVHWTEEGHRYAWRMKLRDKDAEASYYVTEEDGRVWRLDTSEWLTPSQEPKIAARPDLIVQFAHAVETELLAAGGRDVAITADVWVSLNQREPAQLIDPGVDLTRVSYPWLPPASWILALDS